MVDFFDDDRGQPTGPCRMIMTREGQFIREMVAETERTGKEQIATVISIQGDTGHTEMLEGTEESITGDISSKAMMDGMRLAHDMDTMIGGLGSDDYDSHQIHTHPGGHTGLSLTDMKSYANDIVTGAKVPDSELVATMTDNGIVLGGVYIDGELDADGVADIQSVLSMLNSNKMPMSHTQAKDEMLSAFERAGVGFCSVTFPQR